MTQCISDTTLDITPISKVSIFCIAFVNCTMVLAVNINKRIIQTARIYTTNDYNGFK